MKRIENLCVDCQIPCVNCGLDKTMVWYCDRCGEEYAPDELFDYDGEELCANCLVKEFVPISVKEGVY
jgi:hypothetical protein